MQSEGGTMRIRLVLIPISLALATITQFIFYSGPARHVDLTIVSMSLISLLLSLIALALSGTKDRGTSQVSRPVEIAIIFIITLGLIFLQNAVYSLLVASAPPPHYHYDQLFSQQSVFWSQALNLTHIFTLLSLCLATTRFIQEHTSALLPAIASSISIAALLSLPLGLPGLTAGIVLALAVTTASNYIQSITGLLLAFIALLGCAWVISQTSVSQLYAVSDYLYLTTNILAVVAGLTALLGLFRWNANRSSPLVTHSK